jgi:hypothetical protein
MPALRGVVGTRQRRLAGVAIAAAALAAGGCATFDAALGKQELVVTFRAGTSQATMLKARAACATLPHATPEPVPTALNATSGVYDVRFRIDQATDADVARLEQCLSKFPSIQGVNVEQQGGD